MKAHFSYLGKDSPLNGIYKKKERGRVKETAKEMSADGRVNWVRKLVLVCKMAHKYVENGLAEFIYIKRILQISSTHNTHPHTHTETVICAFVIIISG